MKNLKKVVIDTNLLVRYLTMDDPQKAQAVEVLLDQAEGGQIKILLPSVVIAELVWVLESFYEMTAFQIVKMVQAVLNTPGLELTEKSLIISALKLYQNTNMSLIDAWIIEFAKEKDITEIYTFDKKHFKNIKGIESKSP